MVRKRRSLSDIVKEEVKERDIEPSPSLSPTSSPKQAVTPQEISISSENIEVATPTTSPTVKSSRNIAKTVREEPEKSIDPSQVLQNKELQNRVSDLESALQQQKNLVTNLKTELEQNQELQQQLEAQQKLVRELQIKLQQEEKAKQELEKERLAKEKEHKQEEEATKSLELATKPKYTYIMPNRPMVRLLDNPSAAQNLSDEEIGWFD